MKCSVLIIALCFCASEGLRLRRQVTNTKFWQTLGNGAVRDQVHGTIDDRLNPDTIPIELSDNSNGPNEQVVRDFLPRESCSTNNRACVQFTKCQRGKIISDGFGTLTTSSGKEIKQHSECPLYFDVCCEGPDVDDTIERVEPHAVSPLPQCGKRNYKGVGATIDRLKTGFSQFGEFPWMTAILKVETIAESRIILYICGGTLISSNIILTAAHCIFDIKTENLIVRVGEWDMRRKYEPFQHQEREASTVINHPEFNPITLAHDYSIVVLKTPFDYAPNVAPICLPNVNDNFDGHVCYATGWGRGQFEGKSVNKNVMKMVDLEVISDSNCEAALKQTRLGKYFELHNTFTCAGGKKGKDTCNGDGGSPLVCKKEDPSGSSYYQTGIVAWGIGCGENGVPGVYADVRQAVEWIKTEMGPYEL